MGEEQKVLEEMGLWVESTPPGNKKKILRSRWLLGTNWDMEGNIKRCKARIIVGGHWQEKNVNYDKTFAPTPTFYLPRTALTVAAKLGWSVASFDVKTVSLHSPIDKDVWVVPPPGNKVMPGKDHSTYTYKHNGGLAFLWIHVDDGLLVANLDNLLTIIREGLSGLAQRARANPCMPHAVCTPTNGVRTAGLACGPAGQACWPCRPVWGACRPCMPSGQACTAGTPVRPGSRKPLESRGLREPLGALIRVPFGTLIRVPNGTLIRVPLGTLIRVPLGTLIRVPLGTFIRVPSGTLIRVPFGTLIRVPNGTLIRVPLGTLIRVPLGTLIRVPNGTLIRVPLGNLIRVPNGTLIRVPNGTLIRVPLGTLIRVPNGTLIRVPLGTLIRVPLGTLIRVPNGTLIRVPFGTL
ncbi:hypothetical protein PCANC_18255 [Puccinia coronata f. sp. avenae]|uniref:Reverse transcriptase Ty1/copia-type domain-containing protein n=1 Tax=Puccinia coronata f. sp. avenae TaxID=200324 RepID=A0A2N5UQX5_9BASI|nr:hypothetical protein PCANC_18255 [Puccinia coronata f. sp. avenae]